MIQLNSFNQIQQIYKYLRQKRENEKFYTYIEIAATFTLISLFLLLAIRPTATAIFTLLGEIKSKEALSAQMKAKINSVVRAQDSYSKVQGNYDLISSSLPDRPKFYQAASNFSAMSDQTDTNLSRITFGLSSKDKPSDDIESFTTSLIGKNQYQSIIAFIQKIMNSRRLIQLDTINLSKGEDKENAVSNFIDVSINTQLFYLKDNHAKN